ncbi:MAG: flagellar protein FliT, partial [Sedimenticola sp.]
MTNPISDLQEALSLSEVMLAVAEKGDWDALRVMDESRRGLVEAWVEHEGVSADREQADVIMNEMISLNQQIKQLAVAAKQQLMDEFKGLRKKRVGADAYSKCP